MTDYRRAQVTGTTWFFTVNLAERQGSRLLVERIDALRAAFCTVRQRHPFRIEAVVVLPDLRIAVASSVVNALCASTFFWKNLIRDERDLSERNVRCAHE